MKKSPIGVVVATAALLAASVAPAASAYTPDDLPEISLPDGRYVVVLNQPAAAAEAADAGVTQAFSARGFDVTDPSTEHYIAQLEADQVALAESVGAQPEVTYQVALNGFVANLSGAQAAKLSSNKSVFGVYPDEILHTDAVVSSDWMGLPDAGGAWDQTGGVSEAGKGIVVGIVDTGVAPENLSFAGDPLGTTPGDEPYLDGNEIVFHKADGSEFRSERVTGEDWDESLYSTKLVGAKYFNAGAIAAGFDFGGPEFASPRDWSGHGSHTGSTAAGNYDVEAVVNGVPTAQISGVAPAAKVAHYKACYDGPDPDSRDDDICATSDLLAAIEAAVSDGVDVINFSIGGGATTTVTDAFDLAFYNAALAGIFVSASAGNSGPGASTLDHASPWYTTVANSTMPDDIATATFRWEDAAGEPQEFKASGLTIGLPTGDALAGDVVQGLDVALADADPAEAALCGPGSLDPDLAAGKIIVCDRGVHTFVAKGEEIDRVGGLAFLSVNTPSSAQTVFATSTAVPHIHLPAEYFDGITDALAQDGVTAVLTDTNDTGWVGPAAPIVNDSSSRGPALAVGSDVIKPDVSAPGTNVLAAIQSPVGADGAFDFLTGTSMAAPQVAGLAALYLTNNPYAGPGEVKSAIMTTAYGLKVANGDAETNVFAQGTGNIDPARALQPGLIYDNGANDWAAYLKGLGYDLTGTPFDRDVDPIDPSDLNLASIGIGELLGSQTVTRTLTALTPGTYTVTPPSLYGVDVEISPSTLTFDSVGEQQSYEITFSVNEDVVIGEWAMGYLTWSGDGGDVRSSVAVKPAALAAPEVVYGEGITGSTEVEVVAAFTGELEICETDLVLPELQVAGSDLVDGHTGDETTWYSPDEGPLAGALPYPYQIFIHEIEDGIEQARFNLSATPAAGADVDLDYELYYFTDAGLQFVDSSGNVDATEEIVVDSPAPGEYLSVITEYSATGDYYWDATFTALGAEGADLVVDPSAFPVTQGENASFEVSWAGLEPEQTYYALVTYCGTGASTLVVVETGETPEPVAPSITSGALPNGEVGEAYSFPVTADGDEPITFAATGLPAGLSIDPATGVISGTPTEAGSYSVVVTVSNAAGSTSETYTLVVAPSGTTPTPTPTPTPTDTTTPAPTPSPTESGLPITGAGSVAWLGVLAAVLAVFGLGIAVAARRKAHAEADVDA